MAKPVLKVGMVGVGHMGRFHLNKFLNHPLVKVEGFLDTNLKSSQKISEEFQIRSFESLTDLFFECDAICVASPTETHYGVVRQALEQGMNVLVEKPLSETVEQAQILTQMALEKKLLLQVGFLERFRFWALTKGLDLSSVTSIEARRSTLRSKKTHHNDIISDLMLHDIDLASLIMGNGKVRCEGNLTDFNAAEARLEFEKGRGAYFQANRDAPSVVRTFRMLAGDRIIILDFVNNRRECFNQFGSQVESFSNFELKDLDALSLQCDSFVGAVLNKGPAVISGEDGIRALRLIKQIREKLESPLGKIPSPSWPEVTPILEREGF